MSAVRSYLRFGLPYSGLDELLAKRGVEVHHVTVFRWVQRFTRLLIDRSPTLQPNPAAQPCSPTLQPNPVDAWATVMALG